MTKNSFYSPDGYESTVETSHHEYNFIDTPMVSSRRQTLESCKQSPWYHGDGSPVSDEGFDEPAVPEDHLPDFRQLQVCCIPTDLNVLNQMLNYILSCPVQLV